MLRGGFVVSFSSFSQPAIFLTTHRQTDQKTLGASPEAVIAAQPTWDASNILLLARPLVNNADRRQTTNNTISVDTTSTSSRHLWFSFDFSWSISCCFGTAFSHHQKGVGWWDGWF
jgi:hypothetical protein